RARAARSLALSRRPHEPRRRGGRARARAARRTAAPAGPRARGRGHSAHRGHRDVVRGQRRIHRPRARCGGVPARRVRRRRAAARGRDRPRDRHEPNHRAALARPLLRVRNAPFGPALRRGAHLVHAPRRRALRRDRRCLRGACRGRQDRAREGPRKRRADRGRARGRHALRRPGAPRHRGAAGPRARVGRPRGGEETVRRRAPAPLRHQRSFGARRGREPAGFGVGAHEEAPAGAHRPWPRAQSTRAAPGLLWRGGTLTPDTRLHTRCAARGQPHRGPGAGRGRRIDDRAAPRRPAARRRLRQPGYRSREEARVKPRRGKADAVLTEIVRNGVIPVTEEMKTNLMRTAYNMIIYEALDFTVGLYTAEGETVSIGLGLPSFIRGMAETVKAKLRHFGPGGTGEGIHPGDILVTNDAYITGSHLHHFTFTLPIFHRGRLSGFACCMAHWPDVGGLLGGVTTDIYSEGLQIPIVKYQKRGVVNRDLVDIIQMNVRIPERAMGDLRAQITAIRTGERRFLELLERYGRDEVLDAIRNIMAQSEAAARARTRTIPDGTYEAESYMDDDGVEIGKRVPIKVRVIKKRDTMSIDLTEVSPQVRGFFNSGM